MPCTMRKRAKGELERSDGLLLYMYVLVLLMFCFSLHQHMQAAASSSIPLQLEALGAAPAADRQSAIMGKCDKRASSHSTGQRHASIIVSISRSLALCAWAKTRRLVHVKRHKQDTNDQPFSSHSLSYVQLAGWPQEKLAIFTLSCRHRGVHSLLPELLTPCASAASADRTYQGLATCFKCPSDCKRCCTSEHKPDPAVVLLQIRHSTNALPFSTMSGQ